LFLSGRATRNESEGNTNGEADSRALIQTQFQELSQKLLAVVNDRQRDIRGIEERHRAEIEEMKIKYEEDIRTTALAAASARQHSTQVFDEETRRREEQLEEQTKELEEFKNQLEEEANQLQTLKRQFSGEAERLQTKLDESNSELERMRTEMEKLKIETSQNEKGREEYERKLEEVWQKWAEKERAEMEKNILEYKTQLEAQTPSTSSSVPSQDHIEQLLTSQRTVFQQKEAELQLLLQQAQEEVGKVLGSSSLNDERASILEEELKESRQRLTERESLLVQLQDSLVTATAESEERGKVRFPPLSMPSLSFSYLPLLSSNISCHSFLSKRIESLETEKKTLAEERQGLSQRLEHQRQQINEFEELLRETSQRSSLQNQQTEAKMAELEEEKQRLGTQLLVALEGASINIQAAEESLFLKQKLHQLEEEKQKNEVLLRQSFERELREQQLKSQEVLENEQVSG
jgi:hypothetical protein